MTGYRRYGRTLMKCAVKLEHDRIGEIVAETRDVSAAGMFVICRDLVDKLAVGDAMKAQVCSDERCYISSQLTVVRLTEDGAGFAYE